MRRRPDGSDALAGAIINVHATDGRCYQFRPYDEVRKFLSSARTRLACDLRRGHRFVGSFVDEDGELMEVECSARRVVLVPIDGGKIEYLV